MPNIFENINKSTEQIKNQIVSDEKATGYAGNLVENIDSFFSQSLLPRMKSSDYLRAASGWVYSCVGVIADEVASIDLKMMQMKGNDVIEVDDHEALDVLYRANNAMTRFDLINLTFQYLELTGEAPWFISYKNSKPDQIILLRPDRITVKPGKDGEMIGGYKYRVYSDGGMKEVDLEPFEIVYLKYADPDMPLRGKGPLQAAAITYDLDNYAEKWNSQFFRNSASPSAALQTDKTLAKDVRKRLEAKIRENYTGTDNAHKTMILESGLEWKPISLTQKDMDFIEQQRFSRDKILAIFRVPKTAIGISEDVNRANAEATDYVFAKRTIKPKMMRFIEQLNEFFLPLFGETDKYFDFEDPVPQNVTQDISRAQSGVQAGYMTINEAREIMGLDPVPDGDVLRDPMSFAPTVNQDNQPMKALKRQVNKATRQQIHLHKAHNRKIKNKEKERKVIEKTIEETLQPIIYSYLKKAYHKRPFTKGTPEELDKEKLAFQEKQLNVAQQYEEKIINRLNTVFNKQKEVVLRQIDSGEKPKLDVTVEVNRYLETLKPTMINMMKEQSDLVYQLLGLNHPFNDHPKAVGKPLTFLQRLSRFFEIRTFRFATEVSQETNQKLRDHFSEGLTAGESIPQLKSRISSLFEDMSSYRSERIARTESILASNFSSLEAYKESGVVEAKEWLATMDERTDDECASLNGKVMSLDSKFFSHDYFSGQEPPLHANCRCTLIPVVMA